MRRLLIATHNTGKLAEYRALLADLPLELVDLRQAGVRTAVPETGATFAENAILKAVGYAAATGLWTWADDSGLDVDALGGQPGVLSARYGGPGLDDRGRYAKLLSELAGKPQPWTARFRCVTAIAVPGGEAQLAEGVVEGVITPTPRGEHGFGYDPVFYLPTQGVTMAELPAEVKNHISHRGLAAAEAKRLLFRLLAQAD